MRASVSCSVQTSLSIAFRSKASHERREAEGVTAILDAEDAHEKAVADQHEASPSQDCNGLQLWVCNARDLIRQRQSREGEKSV